MSAQKGKDLLLKLDAEATGSFVTVAGLRARRIVFGAEAVDVTHADSTGRWRELLAGAGTRRAGVTGSGVFVDAASDAAVRGLVFDGAVRPWQIIMPDLGTVEGPFQVTALEWAGDHAGEVTFEIALESAGALTFTAA